MSAALLPSSSCSIASPMRFSVRLDNAWITTRSDVARVFHPGPLRDFGDAGAINGRKQELS